VSQVILQDIVTASAGVGLGCDNACMQPLHVLMTVSGPFGQYTTEAIVDPDATFSRVPAPALIELGIEPHRVVRLGTDDGSVRFCQLGRALTTLEGQEDVAPVLFGDPGEPSVAGATTLAILLLRLDADARRLLPKDASNGSAPA
jgi:predicted aspartyl protease